MSNNIYSFSLYDTYKKDTIVFDPNSSIVPGTIKMYSCGPTVYQYQHIGNLRAAFFADTIARTALIANWHVDWVLNITDVGHLVGDGDDGKNVASSEDKLEKSAKKEGKSVQEIVKYYTDDYLKQTSALNLKIPTELHNPKATQYIEEQMVLALDLLKNGRAYVLNNGIYFDSERNSDLKVPFLMQQGDHKYTGREIENTTKNPSDFALWKFVDSNSLQKWRFSDFPSAVSIIESIDTSSNKEKISDKWGCPGWHSECVAMICKILGTSSSASFDYNSYQAASIIDLHLGGEDHIDIHHKNEIIQSEALGFHLSKAWVHNKFVVVNGKKMSKSIGNVYQLIGDQTITGFQSIKEEGYEPLAYRMMLLEHHFQQQLDFTWSKLNQSQNRLLNLRKEAAKIFSFAKSLGYSTENNAIHEKQKEILLKPLLENLDTPLFLEKFQQFISEVSSEISQNQTLSQHNMTALRYWEDNLLELDLLPIIPEEVLQFSEKRAQARAEKNYQLSDTLRSEIHNLGFMVDDYPWGFAYWIKQS